jgi:hydroxyethylthiazole kinase-like uncharacterized protein yjeF
MAAGAPAGGLFELRDWRIVPAPALRVLPVADARAIDRLATERSGIPTLLLMERAALGLEVVAVEMLAGRGGDVVILCGPGSNGGDGFALGRLLLQRGVRVRAHVTPGAGASGDAAINRDIYQRLGGAVVEGPPTEMPAPAVVVDALFGTGLSRPIEGPAAELVQWANTARAAGARTLAVDIPSGIDATTGEPLGPAIVADTTVTFVGAKPGLLTAAGRARSGRIVVAPIGSGQSEK